MIAYARTLCAAVVLTMCAHARGQQPTPPSQPQTDDDVPLTTMFAAPVNPPAASEPAKPGISSDIQAALAAGDGRRALALLDNKSLQLSPAERFSFAGQAYFLLGDYAEARRKLESALRQRQGNSTDLYWLGRVHAAAGMPALAAARFEEAAWNGLETADLHYRWALALKAGNDLLGKISQLPPEKDSKESPTPGTFTARGLVVGPVPSRPGWTVVSPTNSAIYQVHRAIELDPQRGDALLLCAQIWAAVNRHEEAAAAFAKAAERLDKKDLPACREAWATSLLAIGDLDGYLEQTKQRLTLGGEGGSAELARAYDLAAKEAGQRGDLKRQINFLTQAVELDPAGVDRSIALADALLQVQRVDDAARQLRTALQHNPTRKQKKEIAERLQRATYLSSPR